MDGCNGTLPILQVIPGHCTCLNLHHLFFALTETLSKMDMIFPVLKIRKPQNETQNEVE